MAEAKSVKNQ